jgi:hypothetical protein
VKLGISHLELSSQILLLYPPAHHQQKKGFHTEQTILSLSHCQTTYHTTYKQINKQMKKKYINKSFALMSTSNNKESKQVN